MVRAADGSRQRIGSAIGFGPPIGELGPTTVTVRRLAHRQGRAVLRDCLIARRQHVPERLRRRDEIPIFGIATSSPAGLSQPRATPATPKEEPVTGSANVPYAPV